MPPGHPSADGEIQDFGTLVYSVDPLNPEETIKKLEKIPMGSVDNIYKALYPSNRWRDSHDFNAIAVKRDTDCFIALTEERLFRSVMI